MSTTDIATCLTGIECRILVMRSNITIRVYGLNFQGNVMVFET